MRFILLLIIITVFSPVLAEVDLTKKERKAIKQQKRLEKQIRREQRRQAKQLKRQAKQEARVNRREAKKIARIQAKQEARVNRRQARRQVQSQRFKSMQKRTYRTNNNRLRTNSMAGNLPSSYRVKY